MKDTPFQRLISLELERLATVHARDTYAIAHTSVRYERPVESKWYTALIGRKQRKEFSFSTPLLKLFSLVLF